MGLARSLPLPCFPRDGQELAGLAGPPRSPTGLPSTVPCPFPSPLWREDGTEGMLAGKPSQVQPAMPTGEGLDSVPAAPRTV